MSYRIAKHSKGEYGKWKTNDECSKRPRRAATPCWTNCAGWIWLYHACWDMMFLFGIWMDWYIGWPGRLWQQSICWVFILLSGFCVPLGHRTLKRGAQVFAAGALVTVVTLVFMPEDRVVFGVLTFLGSAMLLTGVLEPLLKKIPPAAGLAVSAVLFALTYHLDER